MPKQIHFTFAALLFSLIASVATPADAQHLRSRQPLQAGFRWLGEGWSAGYHHQNPGPNTDYYNPYTAHNSMLISKMPGYQARHNPFGGNTTLSGSSHSNRSTWDQGQSIQPTFVPSNNQSDEDSTEEPTDSEDQNDSDSDVDLDDLTTVKQDSNDSNSSPVDEDSDEDAEFEDSSFDEEDIFDKPEADSGSGTKATKTGFSKQEPGSFDAMSLDSIMLN